MCYVSKYQVKPMLRIAGTQWSGMDPVKDGSLLIRNPIGALSAARLRRDLVKGEIRGDAEGEQAWRKLPMLKNGI
jgi:hypothetical protein